VTTLWWSALQVSCLCVYEKVWAILANLGIRGVAAEDGPCLSCLADAFVPREAGVAISSLVGNAGGYQNVLKRQVCHTPADSQVHLDVGRSRLMRRSQQLVIQCSLSFLSSLAIVAVAFLPWRDGGVGNPFHLGTHLYQMGLPALTAGLVVFALATPILGLLLDRGDWPACLIAASGIGIVILVLLVQHTAATSVFVASSLHIHTGNALAIVAGALITFVGVWCLFARTRASSAGTLVRT